MEPLDKTLVLMVDSGVKLMLLVLMALMALRVDEQGIRQMFNLRMVDKQEIR